MKIDSIEHSETGPIIHVLGADLRDGTPILDIKPYIPYADCHPDAAAGFTAQTQFHHLTMVCDAGLWARVPADQQAALQGVLENDPAPPTSTTRSGSTAWSSAGWKSTSKWTARS